jgi:DNA-binding LytR/AlgR family response regulator
MSSPPNAAPVSADRGGAARGESANGAKSARTAAAARIAADLALMAVIGAFLGMLGPFGTDNLHDGPRYLYWELCIVGGGAIGVAIDEALGRRVRGAWRRVGLDSLLMTPLVTVLVLAVGLLVFNHNAGPRLPLLTLQVFVISVAVMTVRALVWRAPRTIVETRTLVAPPLPEAEAAFRCRLSAKRRAARLIAVEAYDHWLRVHTDAGSELITLRFQDALDELAAAHGLQIHRSWWVAADAIEDVRWRRGAGEAKLAAGVTAPVSRTYAKALKEAGWF